MSGDPFDFGGGRPTPAEARPAPLDARPVAGGAGDGFGTRFRRPAWDGSPRAAVRPPAGWLAAALVLAVVATVLALVLGGTVTVAVLCWVAAGPVAIGLLAVFVLLDTRAAARPIYLRPSWIRPLWATTIVLVIVGIAASAWRIADWWGRL